MYEYGRQATGFAASVNEVGLGNKQHDVEGRRSGRHRIRRRVPAAIVHLANHKGRIC
jgi:hypothetical protein